MPETTESLTAMVALAVADHAAEHARWDAADFAAETALAFLAARPSGEEGDRARGVRDGLELAARILLARAGIPATPEHLETPR